MPKPDPSQPTPREVYYAARRYLPYLPQELQQAMRDLLRRAQAGEKVDNAILETVSRDSKARKWLSVALLTDEAARMGYELLPGPPGPIPARSLWVCPQCGFEWRVFRRGSPVPPCPKDGLPLERKGTSPDTSPKDGERC